ncbi:hypothetical protein BGX26_007934, partial [Mortierella sp. AD094]
MKISAILTVLAALVLVQAAPIPSSPAAYPTIHTVHKTQSHGKVAPKKTAGSAYPKRDITAVKFNSYKRSEYEEFSGNYIVKRKDHNKEAGKKGDDTKVTDKSDDHKPKSEDDDEPKPEGDDEPKPEGDDEPKPEGDDEPKPEGDDEPKPEGDDEPKPE